MCELPLWLLTMATPVNARAAPAIDEDVYANS